jgi:threonine/homoserine/homoserine lactone efflux protein
MDRETRVELVVSVASVLVMIALMFGIGMQYGTDKGILDSTGGFALAGAVLFFVVFMTLVGYGLAYYLKDGEDNGNPA